MEPFDYLTYKKNKAQNKIKKMPAVDKTAAGVICLITFTGFFVFVMVFIASKSSKMDIEYGRLGNTNQTAPQTVNKIYYDDEEEDIKRFTIDKRLFLIRQEEYGPSESRIIKPKDSFEVISKEEFELLKTNSEEVVKTAEKNYAGEPLTDKYLTGQNETVLKNNPDTKESEELQTQMPQPPNETKAAIKPKLPVKPAIKPLGALDAPAVISKVLVGRYKTLDEARKAQSLMTELQDGTIPFIRKVNAYYSIQTGSYKSFDIAKAAASKLKAKGYDVWILQ